MTDSNDPAAPALFDYSPWHYWKQATADDRARQHRFQRTLCEAGDEYGIGEDCYISPLAAVQNEGLRLGPRSYIAAGAYLTGTLRTGRDCTVNPYAVVRGTVELGDGVRIGAHTSLLAFNHGYEDPDTEVFRQPMSSEGIRIGDDVWIGSHVVVLDGITVADGAVIGAGSVVTKDVPARAVVAGNPARVLRWRGAPPAGRQGTPTDLAGRLTAFADTARAQADDVIARCFVPGPDGGGLFVDAPGGPPTVRAQCDAVEIADLLLGRAPLPLSADEQIARLRSWQDPHSGIVGALDEDGRQRPVGALPFSEETGYHFLCVGYALDLLGSEFAHPLHSVAALTAGDVVEHLEALPWEENPWYCGDWADTLGTALMWNRRREVREQPGALDALFGWLLTHADPHTGLWGTPSAADGLMPVVNGFYRASRGTFAQYGLPVPYPEQTVDSVLRHARDARYTRRDRQTACNILDIAHPLWLTRTTGYRADEIVTLARQLLADALKHWVDGEGFAFRAPHPTTTGERQNRPGLQGTEMWLAIIWYLADLAGVSDALGYRPRGIHRPEPALIGTNRHTRAVSRGRESR
ncbi:MULTISPECIES: DapH/DapD/GlmU-related protein [Streptomyces]|uniref:Acyltransferase n=1 Tax=Streptomyces koelreuteriae TaxID=2838015 RepID=A0ABX8G268_9ACTN|nr:MULTISPECIES: acyltransferase [Streptomyces]QWB27339.1 acyltransferase [Streptomyces koelreuteriae]UUA10423.1 acyltransferase [Streptomyces koelreuteriae]UUA18030.1 acyltransferase [Streptomyces sp. CRCS-T-1]